MSKTLTQVALPCRWNRQIAFWTSASSTHFEESGYTVQTMAAKCLLSTARLRHLAPCLALSPTCRQYVFTNREVPPQSSRLSDQVRQWHDVLSFPATFSLMSFPHSMRESLHMRFSGRAGGWLNLLVCVIIIYSRTCKWIISVPYFYCIPLFFASLVVYCC